ncbi:hypothetical protein FQR65_LT12728 [Abscondita terminalis]|nr:hypothetical protein FQR65_LT12728 [Abscondita terminalis]
MIMNGAIRNVLSWYDYILFLGMLAVSLGVGLYFGCRSDQRDVKSEYLLGGKRMTVFPIAISLIASQISGITLLAVPTDVYKFGSNYVWLCLAIPIVYLAANYFFLPLFYHLQLTSIYEYLCLRFDKRMQRMASFLFILSVFLHNPIVIYIPALAFSQATGINIHWTICIICIICTFYTTIGGFKAVVWTDAIQFFGIIASVLMVLFSGAYSVNGFYNALDTASIGGRLNIFDFTLDPTVRDGFWPVVVGGSVQYVGYVCFNQGNMQKYLSLPKLSYAKRALAFYCIGVIAIIFACVLTGNIVYARYHSCDPITTKFVQRDDQLLSYFVLELGKKIPGLTGIFIAGIFSAALSTLSSSLNTLAAVMYEDFILPYTNLFKNTNKESAVLKIIVLSSGLLCTVMAVFVDKIRGVLSTSIALNSIASGPMLGIFLLGILFPKANAKGAFYGGIAGLFILCSVVIGHHWYFTHEYANDFMLPLAINGCNFSTNGFEPKPNISGITVMSYPADVYKYGSNLIWLCLTVPLGCLFQMYIFLPIFFKLQLTSMYEYLEIRFNRKCRILVSFAISLYMVFFNATVIYIPSLAFSQATNINIYYIAIISCFICILYTTIGGLKAVIWTDAFQFFGMVASTVAVVVVGFNVVGGVGEVWNSSLISKRLDIFEFDYKVRYNFWTIIISVTTSWTSYITVNQTFVQKCLALPSLTKAQISVLIYGFGVSFFLLCSVLTGNIMYSKYKDCDPLSSHLINHHDQILPYFVITISESLSGLVGIFMSGCFCAGLSTFSSVLNTLASTIYEDFLSTNLSDQTKSKREALILKLIVLITGILCTLLMLLVEKFSEILPFFMAIESATLGSILGLFILGALLPFATSTAAFYSTMMSFVFVLWIGLGNSISSNNGVLNDYSKPISIEHCDGVVNSTTKSLDVQEPFILYQISVWYGFIIAALMTIVLGCLLSVFTKHDKSRSTNINIHYIGIFICVICIFYTTIGGLKAVVWTDAFQFIGMVVSSVGVVVVGFKVVGGIDVVYNSSVSTNRLDIFEFDLMVRYNFWTIIIPGAIHWTSFTIATQGFVQKCLALPTLNKARMAVFIYGFGVSFFILCMVLTGNIMYSKYKNCDPLKSGLVSRHDQLLPYFVIDVSESLPGLVGVFMSGCFCAALSTFSSVLNTLASTIYEDFMSPYISDEVKTKREPHILKLIVLITGILSTLLMIAVEQSSEILPVLVTIQGSTLGPILGLFVLGALIPFVTPQAALYSTITSFVFMLWIGLGNIISAMNGTLRDYSKPISIEGCEVLVNSTARSVEVEEAFILYRISVWYHLTIGVLITVVLGIVLSVFTKSKKPSSNKDLFSPVIHRLLK